MERIEVDFTTGERRVIPLTAEEIAALQAQAAPPPAEPTKTELLAQIAALAAKVEALP